jgi:hypothetical protein
MIDDRAREEDSILSTGCQFCSEGIRFKARFYERFFPSVVLLLVFISFSFFYCFCVIDSFFYFHSLLVFNM